jgi:hypothetical protein
MIGGAGCCTGGTTVTGGGGGGSGLLGVGVGGRGVRMVAAEAEKPANCSKTAATINNPVVRFLTFNMALEPPCVCIHLSDLTGLETNMRALRSPPLACVEPP